KEVVQCAEDEMPSWVVIDGDFRTQKQNLGPWLPAHCFRRVAECVIVGQVAVAQNSKRKCDECDCDHDPHNHRHGSLCLNGGGGSGVPLMCEFGKFFVRSFGGTWAFVPDGVRVEKNCQVMLMCEIVRI